MSFFRSIWNDLMYTLRVSPIVTRLIVINFGVFLVANILYGLMLLFGQGEAFNSGLYWFWVSALPKKSLSAFADPKTTVARTGSPKSDEPVPTSLALASSPEQKATPTQTLPGGP